MAHEPNTCPHCHRSRGGVELHKIGDAFLCADAIREGAKKLGIGEPHQQEPRLLKEADYRQLREWLDAPLPVC